MITFYFVVKNGEHSNTSCEETVERFEVDCDYKHGLQLFRGILYRFKTFIKSMDSLEKDFLERRRTK